MVDRPPQPADDDNARAQDRRLVLPPEAVRPLVLSLLVALVLLLACVLWIPRWLYPPLTDDDLKDVKTTQNRLDAAKVQELKDARLKLQNDARTTLLQGLGAMLILTGAGVGAYVAYQQVLATRDQIAQTARDSGDQLKVSEQGLVTDRYTRAVEQLGHEKAPVRLGALYSLEHLAQDNPQYRQTVVDIVCAYLRMPSTPPAQNNPDAEEMGLPANGRDRTSHPSLGREPAREERQVRQTAQRLLADRLRCPPRTSGQEAQLLPASSQQAFWPGISLDLTGATLVDFSFEQVSVIQAQFAGTTFQGDAGFAGATFQADAGFSRATFQRAALFDEATFQGDALFDEATFQDETRFDEATFQDYAGFDLATFLYAALFGGTTFQDYAGFAGATFQGYALFGRATFQRDAGFRNATFQGGAGFVGATFHGKAEFSGVHLLHLDDRDKPHTWPDGWVVRPDPTDPSRGTLVRAEPAKDPGPAPPIQPHPDG